MCSPIYFNAFFFHFKQLSKICAPSVISFHIPFIRQCAVFCKISTQFTCWPNLFTSFMLCMNRLWMPSSKQKWSNTRMLCHRQLYTPKTIMCVYFYIFRTATQNSNAISTLWDLLFCVALNMQKSNQHLLLSSEIRIFPHDILRKLWVFQKYFRVFALAL